MFVDYQQYKVKSSKVNNFMKLQVHNSYGIISNI